MQGWLVLFLKKITRTKTILFIHGEELTTTTSSRFFGKNAKLYLHKTDGVIAVSEFTKNMIHETYGISHNKIQLISNGIDLVDYQPCLQANDIAKKFIAPNRTLIFAVGRLIERKGFDNAIEAINLVKNKSHNVHYVIAGIGEMHNTLTTKINNLGLESTVTLIGKLSHEELSSFYQYCDIFLMPNRQLKNGDTEGFGLVFLEANAFNKPVIGGNYGGAVDAIKHGKTGLLVDSKSTVEIANAVIKLIDNPNLRNKLGSNGKLWAKENNVKIKVNEFLTYCDTVTNLKQSK